ncbi:MAG TPA: hypothetical protein VFM50_06590, partial [Nocardioidaceae bacterium]|nr:hypothetical protein [Nocardioidaceae bacterium]
MSGKATLKSFKAMLAEAKLPERTVAICLRGDLVAQHEQAERDLETAQKAQTDSLAGSGAGAIVERIEALEAQMRDSTYPFLLRALPRHEFRTLMTGHPPRKTDDGGVVQEDALGVNRETFFPAMIRASVVDPELSDDEWTDLLDARLTDHQFQELAWTAWALNANEIDIPFSLAASRAKRDT